MKMDAWLRARAAKLLEELNKLPYTDSHQDDQFALLMAAMRESNMQLFKNAAESSRNSIATIKAEAHAQDIEDANAKIEASILGEEKTAGFNVDKPTERPKIVLKSSILRRV